MDVNFSGGVDPINPDLLIQEMVAYQNRLYEDYANGLNRIVAELKRSLQDYVNRNHPGPGLGLAVPQNGPHFQVMMSSFQELALVRLEMMDLYVSLGPCEKMSDDLQSKTNSVTDESMESIRNTMAGIMHMWENCARQVWRLFRQLKKTLDLARKPIRDSSPIGILRKGISSVIAQRVNAFLQDLAKIRELIYISKTKEEYSWKRMDIKVQTIKRLREFQKRLIQGQTEQKIDPAVITALLQFLSLPKYWDVLSNEKFGDLTKCIFMLAYGEPKGKDDEDPVALGNLPLELLPYEVLDCLLETAQSSTQDGRYLRKTMLENNSIQCVLNEFMTLVPAASLGSKESQSLSPSASAEQFENEKAKVEKMTCLSNVLVHFIGTQTGDGDSEFLSKVNVLLKNSSLMAVLSGYLGKDSVLLDFAGHVPFYRAIFRLLSSIASVPELWPVLVVAGAEGDLQILKSLQKLTIAVTTCSQLSEVPRARDCLDLIQLLPDVQATAEQVEVAVKEFLKEQDDSKCSSGMETEESGGTGMSYSAPDLRVRDCSI